MSDSKSISELKKFGDRTSSFMSLHPSFSSFLPGHRVTDGRIQYVETSRAWFAASEPLTRESERMQAFEDFAQTAEGRRKHAFILPVSATFAKRLEEKGYHRTQVGAEPVFNLVEYFDSPSDPLSAFPRARSLKIRGAKVVEVSADRFTRDPAFRALSGEWTQARKTSPLQFLSRFDPWFQLEQRRIFAVELQGQPQAFVSAAPIYPRNGYYFADIVGSRPLKTGLMELLLIESMRKLREEGYLEVRLGACPLAPVGHDERPQNPALRWIFRNSNFFYNFRSLYEFKSKFNPSHWEPLFLVGSRPIGFSTFWQVIRLHYPEGLLRAKARALLARDFPKLLRPGVKPLPFPATLGDALARMRVSLGFSAVFLALHAARTHLPIGADVFTQVQFWPLQWNVAGIFAGPLFHNNLWHLLGDTSTFILFVAAIELVQGSRLALAAVALGLWASNPLTAALLGAALPTLAPAAYQNLLTIPDVGASNAVYAAAGALGALLAQPRTIILPLALNAIVYTMLAEKILATHHLVALALGYLAARAFTAASASPKATSLRSDQIPR
ncbi:MAG: rhomboid family intramembrane serine protease [Bacteriovoracia bacterium]